MIEELAVLQLFVEIATINVPVLRAHDSES